jgi:hypothetical protein
MVSHILSLSLGAAVILSFVIGGLFAMLKAEAAREAWARYYGASPFIYKFFLFGPLLRKHPRLHLWFIRTAGATAFIAGILVLVLVVLSMIKGKG